MSMKRKLFFREFMEKKSVVVFLSIVLTISFFLSGFEYLLFEASSDAGYSPDVYLYGTIARSSFACYESIEKSLQFIQDTIGEEIKAVPCVTRNIISCSEKNRFNTVNYTIKGYSSQYIRDSLSKYIKEGRSLEPGNKEVVIGKKFAEAMHLSVGDQIDGQSIQLGTIGDITLIITLDEVPDIKNTEAYTVCGILSEKCAFLDYTAVVATEDFFKPNTLEFFFRSDEAPTIYRNILERMPGGMIGGVQEFYEQNRERTIALFLDVATITSAILLIFYLLISLLLKGLNKKLSVMKAVGVTDQYITSSFFGGFIVMLLVAIVLSICFLTFIVKSINMQYAEFTGADLKKIQISFSLIVFLLCVGLFISINLWTILKIKIAKVNPKIDL